LGKIVGSYIVTAKAFIVVNGFIPNIWGWIAPSIIGGIIIVYWNIKLSKKR